MHAAPIATPSPTPAAAFVQGAGWLLGPRSSVVGLVALDDTTVRVVVTDPFVHDAHDRPYADHLVADSARTVLEQAAHGVRLVPVTRDGYVGLDRPLAPAQLTFLNGVPGVSRADLVPQDVDGDGAVAPGEASYRVEVANGESAARVDWLLRDRLDAGTVQPGPVQVVVPETPWLPVDGRR